MKEGVEGIIRRSLNFIRSSKDPFYFLEYFFKFVPPYGFGLEGVNGNTEICMGFKAVLKLD